MRDVMISYSRRDGDFVRRLYADLKDKGRDVWVDWQDIPLSADWWLEIANAIEAADTFVFVVSPDSMGSPICNLEIAHARRNNKRLIPILLRQTEIEDAMDRLNERDLSDNTLSVLEDRTIEEVARLNWNAVSRHNWLYFEDANNFDENMERLINVLETDLAHTKEHTRLLVRASEWDRRDRSSSFLLTGEAVREAENWLAQGMGKTPQPTPLHADYIGASRQAADRRQRRLLIGVSTALVVAVLLAVIAVGLAFFAQEQAEIARVARADAEVQAEIAATNAAEANSLLWASYAEQTIRGGDSPLALALALASVSLEEPPALAQSTLARVAYAPGPIARYAPTTENESVEITALHFDPTGNVAAVALSDRRLQLYELRTGTVITTLTDFQASVTSVAFMPGGNGVLASSFNQIILFDTQTGEPLLTLEHPLGSIVNTIAVSPDGTQALSGANSNQMFLWDLTTGDVIYELTEHTDEVTSVAFSPNGRQFLSGSNDDTVILWNISNGRAVRSYDHSSDVTSVAFNPLGGTFASGTQLGLLQVRNLTTGSIVQTLGGDAVAHGTQPIISLAYSNDGTLLMSGGDDQLAIVWNATTGEPLHIFDAHDAAVTGVDFTPDGRSAITGSRDGSMFWWSISDGSVSRVFDTSDNHTEEVLAVGYSPDGARLVSTDIAGTVLLWNANNGRFVREYTESEGIHEREVTAVNFLPDSERFITGGAAPSLALWDAADAASSLASFTDVHTDDVVSIATHPNGEIVISGDGDGMVVLWDLTLEEPPRILSDGEGEIGHTRDVMDIAFNMEGSLALTGSADRTMILWDVATGEAIRTFEHDGRILGVGFSPDETQVYSGGTDDTIIIWDVSTATVIDTLNIGQEGQTRYTSALTFHQGNAFALTGNIEGGVQLWDMQSGRAIARYDSNRGGGTNNNNRITALAFRADGLAAAVGTRNRTVFEVRTLPLAQLIQWTRANRFIRDLNCDERQIFNIPCEAVPAAATPTPEAAPAA